MNSLKTKNTANPDCVGDHCTSTKGQVRRYYVSTGFSLPLCKACWGHKNKSRSLIQSIVPVYEDWSTAEIVPPSKH